MGCPAAIFRLTAPYGSLEALAQVDLTRQGERLNWQVFFEYGRFFAGESGERGPYGLRFGVPLVVNLGLVVEWQRDIGDRSFDETRIELRHFF